MTRIANLAACKTNTHEENQGEQKDQHLTVITTHHPSKAYMLRRMEFIINLPELILVSF